MNFFINFYFDKDFQYDSNGLIIELFIALSLLTIFNIVTVIKEELV